MVLLLKEMSFNGFWARLYLEKYLHGRVVFNNKNFFAFENRFFFVSRYRNLIKLMQVNKYSKSCTQKN
jgi:hypothetical protein